MTRKPIPTRIALAAALTLLHFGSARAQTAPTAPAPASVAEAGTPANAIPADGLKLDSIVVTGTSAKLSKMKQSVSVSTLDSEQIERSGATGRNLRGRRSGSRSLAAPKPG